MSAWSNCWRSLSCALILVASTGQSGAQGTLSAAEAGMVRSIDAHADADLALLREIVDINSGTMHPDGVDAVKDIIAPRFEALGFKVQWIPMRAQTGRAGDLIAEHDC